LYLLTTTQVTYFSVFQALLLPSVDYATAYIEFSTLDKILDKIHGEPTCVTLKNLKKKLKANAITVVSDLGRGQFAFWSPGTWDWSYLPLNMS